mgnify:CR=1 FL=1
MHKKINRRSFVAHAAISSVGLLLHTKGVKAGGSGNAIFLLPEENEPALMKEVMKYRMHMLMCIFHPTVLLPKLILLTGWELKGWLFQGISTPSAKEHRKRSEDVMI